MEEKIGFIGMGFVGKNLYDNFKSRGYDVVGYSKEKKYVDNKKELKKCKIVFIAVPTPTCEDGFDDSILLEVVSFLANDTIVCIKSTLPCITLKKISKKFEDLQILHVPEFLDENTAREDTDHPKKNIIGVSDLDSGVCLLAAEKVMKILPKAPYSSICKYEESTYIKYVHNCYFYIKNVFFNLSYDMAVKLGADWDVVWRGVLSEPRIDSIHTRPVDKGGRGAGGHCLIKDFAVFRNMFLELCDEDVKGYLFLQYAEERNIEYLVKTDKDVDLVKGIYGKNI